MGNKVKAGEGRRCGSEGRKRKISWRYEQTLMSQAAGLWCDLTKRSARSAQTATLWNWLCVCTRVSVCAKKKKQKQLNVWSLKIDQCSYLSTRQQHRGNDSSLILCVRWQKGAFALASSSVSSDHVWFIKLEFNELSDHGHLPLNQSHSASWKSGMKVLLSTLCQPWIFYSAPLEIAQIYFQKMAPSTVGSYLWHSFCHLLPK